MLQHSLVEAGAQFAFVDEIQCLDKYSRKRVTVFRNDCRRTYMRLSAFFCIMLMKEMWAIYPKYSSTVRPLLPKICYTRQIYSGQRRTFDSQ